MRELLHTRCRTDSTGTGATKNNKIKHTHLPYWAQLLMVLLALQGANDNQPATPTPTSPFFHLQSAQASATARKRLEKTQKVAEGKRPEGERVVGVNWVVIISSCM